MSLLSHVIFRVTVRIDGAIKLLEGHQCHNKLVVGVKETAEIFLVINMVDLHLLAVLRSHEKCRLVGNIRIAESSYAISCKLQNVRGRVHFPKSAPSLC